MSNITRAKTNVVDTENRQVLTQATSKVVGGSTFISDTVNALTATTVIYDGTGAALSIVTGINSVDFTVAVNGSGYWLDRTTFEVKTDAGAVVGSGSTDWKTYDDTSGETPRGVSKVHIKGRSIATNNIIVDGLRGNNQVIISNTTDAEALYSDDIIFLNNGVEVGNHGSVNTNGSTYVASQTLYTNIKWGVTNHGKKYVEAFNPVTNDTMIMYQGSGTAGYEIPHSIGVKMDFANFKNLSSVYNWITQNELNGSGNYMIQNLDTAEAYSNTVLNVSTDTILTIGHNANINTLDDIHILYGKANSNTWKLVEYIGTGVDNTIEIGFSTNRVIIKAVSTTASWFMFDIKRDGKYLLVDTSGSEVVSGVFTTSGNTITVSGSSLTGINALGIKYIALVEADTNSNGGGSLEDLPSLSSTYQGTDLNINYSNGYGIKGALNSNELLVGNTVISPTFTDGNNYIKRIEDSVFEATLVEPIFGEVSTTADYYLDGKWYDLNDIVYTTPITYLDDTVEVVNGNPVDLHEWKVPDMVVDDMKVNNLVVTDSFDLGQKWVDVLSSRIHAVTYINDTGKPIEVIICFRTTASSGYTSLYIDDFLVSNPSGYDNTSAYSVETLSFTIPNNSIYSLTLVSALILKWSELR